MSYNETNLRPVIATLPQEHQTLLSKVDNKGLHRLLDLFQKDPSMPILTPLFRSAMQALDAALKNSPEELRTKKIKQLPSNIPTSLDPSEEDPVITTSPQKTEQITLKFQNGEVTVDKNDLKSLKYFRETIQGDKYGLIQENEFDFTDTSITLEYFSAVKALVCDKKPLHEAVPVSVLQDLFGIETLLQMLDYFHPDTAISALQKDIKQKIHLIMTPKDAYAVIQAYQAQSKEDEKPKKLPIAVQKAQEILIQVKTFETEEEASKFFQTRIKDYETKARLEKELQEYETAFVKQRQLCQEGKLDRCSRDRREDSNKNQQTIIFKRSYKRVDLSNLPMIARDCLSQHTQDKQPFIQEAAKKAKEEVEAYRAKVLEALTISGTDLASANHLLPFLIGPKAYLFDHYEFTIDISKNPKKPFIVDNSNTSFNLKDNSAFNLERAIRCHFSFATLDETCIINDKTPTKPQSEEAKQVRENILSLFSSIQSIREESNKAVSEKLNWKELEKGPSTLQGEEALQALRDFSPLSLALVDEEIMKITIKSLTSKGLEDLKSALLSADSITKHANSSIAEKEKAINEQLIRHLKWNEKAVTPDDIIVHAPNQQDFIVVKFSKRVGSLAINFWDLSTVNDARKFKFLNAGGPDDQGIALVDMPSYDEIGSDNGLTRQPYQDLKCVIA